MIGREMNDKVVLFVLLVGMLLILSVSSGSAFGQWSEKYYWWVVSSGYWSTPENWEHMEWDPDIEDWVPVSGVPVSCANVSIINGGSAILADPVLLEYLRIESSTLQLIGGSISTIYRFSVSNGGQIEQTGGSVFGLVGIGDIEDEGLGTFHQAGGANSLYGLDLGNGVNTLGIYQLSGAAELNVQEWVILGSQGNGVFIQTDGIHTTMGEKIGGYGTGLFLISGGIHTITDDLILGGETDGHGMYEMEGGELSANREYIGLKGTGTFVQSGGIHNVSGHIWLGVFPSSSGAYEMNGGTINAVSENAKIWVSTSSSLIGSGTYNIPVVYQSDDEVDVIFEQNCLLVGGGYYVEQISPDEFGGCTGENLLESSAFYVDFVDGSFSGKFTIAIPYDEDDLATFNADEMSLSVLHETESDMYELLEDVEIDTTENIVYGQANSFGKFALFAEGTGSEAAELAKSVVGGPYLGDGRTWGGKGADCCSSSWPWISPEELCNSGYCYYDGRIGKCNTDKAAGVDCSGLVMWAYNKASNSTGYRDPSNRISWKNENASRQFHNNSSTILPSELMPGDLLFFDSGDPGIDHVEMYVGAFFYIGGTKPAGLYNIVSAAGNTVGIIPQCLSERTQPQTGFLEFRRVTPPIEAGTVFVQCPVDLILTDPDGFTITKDIWEIPGVLYYNVFDIDNDGDLDDMVTITEKKIGDYSIAIVPEPDASPTDTYTLGVNFDGQTLILAENVSVDDIPEKRYIIRSTESGIIPIIPATVDFNPDTLNLNSKGEWVTCYIDPPEGYYVSNIQVESILLDNIFDVQHSDDQNGLLMVKFDRQSLIAYIEVMLKIAPPDHVLLTVTGELTDGTLFEGTDVIRVIDEGGK